MRKKRKHRILSAVICCLLAVSCFSGTGLAAEVDNVTNVETNSTRMDETEPINKPETVDEVETIVESKAADEVETFVESKAADEVETFVESKTADEVETFAGIATADETANKAAETVYSTAHDLYGFVTRMYTLVLGRQPDAGGYENWTSLLESGKATGASIITGFYNSDEYKNIHKNTGNSEFIENCYTTILNRSSDSSGKANWMEALTAGVSRTYILSGFVNSNEFTNLCKSFGISRGNVTISEARDRNLNTTKFVQRLYQRCLGRNADISGLNNWTNLVNKGSKTGADLILDFYSSTEFSNKKLENSDFVENCYSAILNRSADTSGKAGWMSALESGVSRTYVLSGIVNSVEFTNYCKNYGITKGKIAITQARDQNLNTTRFVQRLYQKCLRRNADTSGLNNWTSQINNGSKTAADLVWSFYNSTEFKNLNLGNSDFVESCYTVMLDRTSDTQGKDHWVTQLNRGIQRDTVLAGFVGSEEFSKLCRNYGITRGTITPVYTKGVVKTFICTVYSKPDTASAVDTQALYNQKVQILKVSGTFLQVTVSDGYTGYVEAKNISYSLDSLYGDEAFYVIKTSADITNAAGNVIAQAPMCSELYGTNYDQNRIQVTLPSGEIGYMQKTSVKTCQNGIIPTTNGQAIVDTAKMFIGTQYLWGGTSVKGIDCSGFTYICYRLNGITLPRDAKPQSNAGTKISLANIQVGDLVFFSSSTNKVGVSHTGIYIGNGNFIHSSSGYGGVTISSLNASYYAARLVSVNRY